MQRNTPTQTRMIVSTVLSLSVRYMRGTGRPSTCGEVVWFLLLTSHSHNLIVCDLSGNQANYDSTEHCYEATSRDASGPRLSTRSHMQHVQMQAVAETDTR